MTMWGLLTEKSLGDPRPPAHIVHGSDAFRRDGRQTGMGEGGAEQREGAAEVHEFAFDTLN